MKHLFSLSCLFAVIPAAHGIAFGGSVPTATSPRRFLDETSPKPTKGPSAIELKKRQIDSGPETCGWVDGDYVSEVTCYTGRTCMLYTSASIGMAGCCDSFDTQDCAWASSCVDFSNYVAGNCDADCMSNSFVRKCTNVASAYCFTWTYPSDGVVDYGCHGIPGNVVYTVSQTASNSRGSNIASVLLTILDGDAVTGFDATKRTYQTAIPTTGSSSNGGSTTRTRTKKKIAISLIVGVVIAALFVLFVVIVGVVFFMKKKKKQRLLAANAQIVAANHAQPQFPPAQQQQQQQQNMAQFQQPPQMHMRPQQPQPPYIPPQSPPSTISSYFPPPTQKPTPTSQVYEYAQTPLSNPPTPAPAYVQPHYTAPPMPPPPTTTTGHSTSPSVVGGYPPPADGAHEVDATSLPQAPVGGGAVYELGSGGRR